MDGEKRRKTNFADEQRWNTDGRRYQSHHGERAAFLPEFRKAIKSSTAEKPAVT